MWKKDWSKDITEVTIVALSVTSLYEGTYKNRKGHYVTESHFSSLQAFYNTCHCHPFTYTFIHWWQRLSCSSSGAIWRPVSFSGTFDMQLGEPEIQTSDLSFARPPTLPPELQPPQYCHHGQLQKQDSVTSWPFLLFSFLGQYPNLASYLIGTRGQAWARADPFTCPHLLLF